jgi:putative tricarboxylic transport membrane protein
VIRPIVLGFGSPELLALAMVGLSFIAFLSRGNPIKGLAMGLLGVLTAFVGVFSFTGTPRFTFGIFYLYDGIPLAAVGMGIFAIPELIEMIVSGSIVKVAEVESKETHGVREGIKDCFRHWRTLLACSALGSVLGLAPGVGVMTATFLAYAVARLMSKRGHEFGLGCVEGVIGVESVDNAKEGSSLLTTLAFGIPSGATMAMFLVIIMMAGISPGVEMMTKHLDIIWSLVIALIISNMMAAGIGLVSTRYLVRMVSIRMNFLAPAIVLLVLVGAYGINSRVEDVVLTFFVGGIGYVMKRFDFSRITFIVGFVLGDLIERYFLLSLGMLGPYFITKSPIAMGLLLVIIPVAGHQWIKSLFGRLMSRRGGAAT